MELEMGTAQTLTCSEIDFARVSKDDDSLPLFHLDF